MGCKTLHLRASGQETVLLVVLVDRGRIVAARLKHACHVEARIRAVPIADETLAVHVEHQLGLHRHTHMCDDVRAVLVLLVKIGERGQHVVIAVMGLGEIGELGQDVVPDPTVGHTIGTEVSGEALGQRAVFVDSGRESERLTPEAVCFRIERKNLHCLLQPQKPEVQVRRIARDLGNLMTPEGRVFEHPPFGNYENVSPCEQVKRLSSYFC